MIKRQIAKLLVFVFVFNMIGPFAFTETVMAYMPNLNFDINQQLVLTTQQGGAGSQFSESTPITTTRRDTTEVMKTWSMPNERADHAYEMTFPIDDGIRASLKVQRFGNTNAVGSMSELAYVTYELQNFVGGAWVQKPRSIGTGAPDSYRIYAKDISGIRWSMKPVNQNFFDDQTYMIPDSSSTNYMVLDNHDINAPAGATPPDPTQDLLPAFLIRYDSGFTFSYAGKDILFRWTNGEFQVTTKGIDEGRIHQYTLQAWENTFQPWENGSPSPSYEKKVRIVTGLTGLNFNPLGNGTRASENDPFNYRTALKADPGFQDTANIINRTIGSQDSEDDVWAGSPDIGLEMSVNIPDEWDEATASFIPLRSSSRLKFQLHHKYENLHRIDVEIEGIGILSENAPSAQVTSANALRGVAINDLDVSSVAQRVSVQVSGLQAGLWYITNSISMSFVEFNLIDSDGYKTDRTAVTGEVYTFLHYRLEQMTENGNVQIIIDPYENLINETRGVGYYSVYGVFGEYGYQSPGQLLATVYYDGSSEQVFIPVAIPRSQDIGYFQVGFSEEKPESVDSYGSPIPDWNMVNTYSQVTKFELERGALRPYTPENFRIINSNLRRNDIAGDTGTVEMTLSWDIGQKEVIDTLVRDNGGILEIVYDLEKSNAPAITDNRNISTFVRVLLRITQNDEGALEVQYSEYSQEGIPIESAETPATAVLREISGIYQARIRLQVGAGNKHVSPSFTEKMGIGDVPGDFHFLYENIYFLSVALSEWRKGGTGLWESPAQAERSREENLTLDSVSILSVPPPQDLNISGVDRTQFDISWKLPWREIRNYLSSAFLVPGGSAQVKMNIYISQDEAYMRDVFSQITEDEREDGLSTNRDAASQIFEYRSYDREIFLSAEDARDESKVLRSGSMTALDALRRTIRDDQPKVVKIANIETSFNHVSIEEGISYALRGLDPNQKYYIYVDLEVEHLDAGGDIVAAKISILSNLEATTTKSNEVIPTGEDQVPPGTRIISKREGLGDADITWLSARSLADAASGERMEYEVIRLEGTRMEDGLLDERVTLGVLFRDRIDPKANAVAFRVTTGPDGNELQFSTNGSSFSPSSEEDHEITVQNTNNQATLMLTDRTLTPNTLYFYYVRVVKVSSSGAEVYSVWNGESITTTPIKHPINLMVESDRTDYDPQTEVIISFDARFPNLSMLGNEYTVQYQIRKEDGEWSAVTTFTPNQLVLAQESALAEHFRLMYKISGLENGVSYTIRIRMMDVNGETSMYSEELIFRTEIDQEKEHEKHTTENLNEFLKEMLEDILKQPHWVLEDSNARFSAWYRPSRFEALMAQSPDSMLTLVGSNAPSHVYYLPASVLMEANANRKGFKVVKGDMDVIISPVSINTNSNAIVFEILENIKRREVYVEDYYVRIALDWREMGIQSGQEDQPLTSAVEITFELVESRSKATQFDNSTALKMREEINEILKDPTVLDRISDSVQTGMIPEERVETVKRIVDSAFRYTQGLLSSELAGDLVNGYRILSLDSPLIIVAKGMDSSASIRGYRNMQGIWSPKELTNFGGNKAIYANEPGLYVFAGYVLNIAGIKEVPNSNTVTGIVAKYALDEFFGRGASFNIEADVTRAMVTGSVARMLGAPNGSNGVEWLNRNHNLGISNRNSTSAISSQETLYILMVLYEGKTGSNVSTVRVTNYGRTANFSLDEKYKHSVRAAFEVGIYKNDLMQPNAPMKVKELLEILGNLDNKTRL